MPEVRTTGRSLYLQRRVALLEYILHQIRTTKRENCSEGCSGSFSRRDAAHISVGSAAAIAASGAEGLADSLKPSVRVSKLLDSFLAGEATVDADIFAEECTSAACWKHKGQLCNHQKDGLDLYLCERLLPLVDDGIAALCEYVEKLQADEHQTLSQQQWEHEGGPTGEKQSPGTQPRDSDLLLGRGLHRRFDPLVWLGQYLLRQGKAADAVCSAQYSAGDRCSDLAASVDQRRARGEHIRHNALPLYGAVAAEVRNERGWRAFESLYPESELLFERLKKQHNESLQNQNERHREIEPPQLPAENLEQILEAIDAAWELPEGQGFCAAVTGTMKEHAYDEYTTSQSTGSFRKRSSLQKVFPLENTWDEYLICGSCTEVPLEVADSKDLKFEELWRFLTRCLEVCPALKKNVFGVALKATTAAKPFTAYQPVEKNTKCLEVPPATSSLSMKKPQYQVCNARDKETN